MRVSLKSFVAGFICCALLSATTAYAAVGSTRIEVFFKNVKYMIDGEEKLPDSDKQGFVYKGTTYVPIRFVAEALDKEVLWNERQWNEDKDTIWISDDPGELTMEDLGIDDALTGAQIRLGMTREEVEKLLGAPDDERWGRDMYEGLQVFYRDNKAAGFIVDASDNETNRYRTTRGIGLGSPYREILSQYGSPRYQGQLYDSIDVSYMFKNENGALDKVTKPISPLDDWDNTKVYYLSILLFNNSNQTLGYLMIGDQHFVMTGG